MELFHIFLPLREEVEAELIFCGSINMCVYIVYVYLPVFQSVLYIQTNRSLRLVQTGVHSMLSESDTYKYVLQQITVSHIIYSKPDFSCQYSRQTANTYKTTIGNAECNLYNQYPFIIKLEQERISIIPFYLPLCDRKWRGTSWQVERDKMYTKYRTKRRSRYCGNNTEVFIHSNRHVHM